MSLGRILKVGRMRRGTVSALIAHYQPLFSVFSQIIRVFGISLFFQVTRSLRGRRKNWGIAMTSIKATAREAISVSIAIIVEGPGP